MPKLIPFKCNFGHIIIGEMQKPYPVEIICQSCIKELENGRVLTLTTNNHVRIENNIKAHRF